LKAIQSAEETVVQGCVGAGTGMVSMGFKSGVGSASRIIETEDDVFTVGILSVPNFGRAGDLTFLGRNVLPKQKIKKDDGGSIIVVLATDVPLTSRQLHRLAKRVPLGIARAGGYATHGSGDIIIAFSTATTVDIADKSLTKEFEVINESSKVFNALIKGVVEATQESIYNALLNACSMKGRDNHYVDSLTVDYLLEQLKSK